MMMMMLWLQFHHDVYIYIYLRCRTAQLVDKPPTHHMAKLLALLFFFLSFLHFFFTINFCGVENLCINNCAVIVLMKYSLRNFNFKTLTLTHFHIACASPVCSLLLYADSNFTAGQQTMIIIIIGDDDKFKVKTIERFYIYFCGWLGWKFLDKFLF